MFEDIQALLDLPGMGLALKIAPLVWAVIWIFLTVSLWRGGFVDLVEKLNRPRWAGPERVRAVMMMPLRAMMLALVAALAATVTTLGIGFNVGVVMGVVQAIQGGG
ncbi:hypothetical protein [Maricaulis maris]|uniref:Uncharacterized protein n=1 Tax=Maricaulis maris TaxID=74318 RepID=A0A495DKZ7_9PROT|nr:hypothetical protein [Maricaulis maris]RKR03612.1 hypothetical protein C7435_0049 [Maricaulis maris]